MMNVQKYILVENFEKIQKKFHIYNEENHGRKYLNITFVLQVLKILIYNDILILGYFLKGIYIYE